MFLYLYLIMARYDIGSMYSANADMKEIVWKHKFSYPDNHSDPSHDSNIPVYIEDVQNERGLFEFLKNFEEDLIVSEMTTIKRTDEVSSTSDEVKLYFLYNSKNYIVVQGVTYCASFVYEEVAGGPKTILKKPIIVDYENSPEYEWNYHALEDYGGYCFAFFYSDDKEPN